MLCIAVTYIFHIGCPPNTTLSGCITNPCDVAMCPAYQNSVCEVDKCVKPGSDCKAKHFVKLEEVTQSCGKNKYCEDLWLLTFNRAL